MNKQDNQEINNQQSVTEDLPVAGEQAEEVKAGSIYIKTVRFRAGKDVE